MGEFKDFFKNKKNLANVLILGILILAIPLGINLVKTQQIIKSRATGDPIVFTGANVKQKSDGTWTALKPQISLLLSSQLGPPALTAPGTTTATCIGDGKTATVSWGSVSGAVSYLLRFNKDPQEDWTGPGDFSATLPSSSTSYQTGTIPSIGLCSWGTSHDDQHCTSCTGQESSCVTTGVNPNFVPGVHYTVSVEPHDVNGVAGSRSAADFTCGTGTGQSDNSISASSDTCQVAAADGTCASPINIGWKTTNTPGANVCVSSINGNTQFSAPSEWHMATCSDFPTCAGTPNRTNTWISPGDMFTLYAGASGCSGASCYCTGTNLGSVTITAAQSSALLSADMQNGTISIPNLLTNGTLGNMKSSTVAAGSQNVQWFGSATKPATVAYYKLTGTSSGGSIQADIYIPNDQYQSTSQKDTSFFISGNQYFAAILRADANSQTTFSNVALYQSADHVQWFGSATLAAPGNYTLSGTVTGDGVIQADVYKAGVYEKTNTSPSTFTINSDEYFAVIDRAFSGTVSFANVKLVKNQIAQVPKTVQPENLLMSLLPKGLVKTAYAVTCSPNQWTKSCTGGCCAGGGERHAQLCNSDGTGWAQDFGECTGDCASACASSGTPTPPPSGSGSCTPPAYMACPPGDWDSNCQDKSKTCPLPQGATAGTICTNTCRQQQCLTTGESQPVWTTCILDCNRYPNDPSCNGGNAACDLGTNTFGLTDACATCIASQNPGPPPLPQQVINLGSQSGHTNWGNCSNDTLIGDWCQNINSSQCNSQKSSAACAQACGGNTPAPTTAPTAPAATTAPTAPAAAAPSAQTVSFRIAENPTDLANATWQSYTADPTAIDYTFKDTTPGVKTIFVDFKDSNGKIDSHSSQITLLGAGPTISGCNLSVTSGNAAIDLTGVNFRSTQGTVVSGTTDLTSQLQSWTDTDVKLVWSNAPVGQSLPITLTNTDGQTVTAQCSSISPLTLGAKVFCRAPSDHQTDNVDMELAGAFAGGTLVKQKVSIDKDGNVLGLDQNLLQAGKQYNISLKAPGGLRKTATFTATAGTTQLSNFVLPIGDIFPADGGDGVINSLDKSELNRQWNISGDVTGRTGDFNHDSRVNSIDWACMRYDFNSTDDPEPVVGGV